MSIEDEARWWFGMKPSNADLSFDFAQFSADTGETLLEAAATLSASVWATWVHALVNRSTDPLVRLTNDEVSHPPNPPDEAPIAVV